MIVTQEKLIKDISIKEDIDIMVVRRIIRSMENIIISYLSSTTYDENTVIKILKGLSLECKYIPEKEIHTYDDIVCKPRIWAKPKLTRYFNRKINKQ